MRNFRLGEWLPEAMTPLITDWLLERLELVLLEVVRPATDQRFELARAQPQDLGLLPGRLGVVCDL